MCVTHGEAARRAGLGEDEQLDGHVDVGRAVGGDEGQAQDQLVELHAHQAGHHRRGRRYGRYDPPGDELALPMGEKERGGWKSPEATHVSA